MTDEETAENIAAPIPLRVLIVEDSEEDALLLLHELKHGGYDPLFKRVDDAESMKAALDDRKWDIIISDYMMPGFSGLSALELFKSNGFEAPFIIVSGRIGEDIAVGAMKAGAHDYIIKGNLARLIPAIRRELKDAETRRERRKAEAELEKYRYHLEDIVEERTAELKKINERLQSEMRERRRAEEELKRHRDHLEEIVRERAAALIKINEQLQLEISERTRVEEGLIESEEKFRRLSQEFHTLLDAIPDSLILLSPDLTVMWANRGAARAVGRDITGMTGMKCYQLWCGAAPCDKCPALRSFESGKEEYEQTMTQDGRVWDLRSFPIKDAAGRIINVIEIAGDITEKIAMQADAMRTAHLASMGEMAAGVAHEINNPINGIINYAQVLADRSPEDSREWKISNRIIREGDRIANIVKSLLTFAHDRHEDKSPIHVCEILSESLALTEGQMSKKGIILKIDLPRDLPAVVVAAHQIQQVFLNIINNARYALNSKFPGTDEGKCLVIKGREVVLDDMPYVRITFHDTGSGINRAILDKVINPFFTTKPTGKGTGLGLSISHGIIKDHGGRLSIESVEGEYTKVTVDLPSARSRKEQEL